MIYKATMTKPSNAKSHFMVADIFGMGSAEAVCLVLLVSVREMSTAAINRMAKM